MVVRRKPPLPLSLSLRAGIDSLVAYLPIGAGLWLALHAAGVQAATSGALLGLAAPAGRSHRVVERMERLLHPWASFAIAPLFVVVIYNDTHGWFTWLANWVCRLRG